MNKLLAITALALLSVGFYSINNDTLDYQAKFQKWSVKYNKNYTPVERAYRLSIYEENVRMIETHNADPTKTYKMGQNQFADLTHQEFVETYLYSSHEEIDAPVYIPTKAAAPAVDWSNLTSVKDQGNCKSAWAFAAIGAIESIYRIKNVYTNDDLSVQQLVDCDTWDKGCQQGAPDYAYLFVKNSGLVTEAQYPYAGVKQACLYATGPYKMTGYNTVKYEDLKSALSQQPISVEVDSSLWAFYESGVFNDCYQTSINHAALAVGYYTDGTWIVKNSWGTGWGENGFIRLASGNTCYVGSYARMVKI